MPLVSVALSTYNGARYLREQLDSVLAQQDVELELVAVDDGSRDDTCAVLEAYASRDPRVSWSANPHNLGPTRSFERAMSLCRGEFIAPCDQDDIWHPRKLRTLLDAIGDADLAYCDSEYVDGDGRPHGKRVSDDLRMLQGRDPAPSLIANSVSGHAALVRRTLVDEARPIPPDVYHDWWLALLAAGRHGVVYVPQALVAFRRHGEAFSPMGKGFKGLSRERESMEWLGYRVMLMDAYAARGFRDAQAAAELADGIRHALATGRKLALMRLLWRYREAAPKWSDVPIFDALKLCSRVAKKVRRARRAAAQGLSTRST